MIWSFSLISFKLYKYRKIKMGNFYSIDNVEKLQSIYTAYKNKKYQDYPGMIGAL